MNYRMLKSTSNCEQHADKNEKGSWEGAVLKGGKDRAHLIAIRIVFHQLIPVSSGAGFYTVLFRAWSLTPRQHHLRTFQKWRFLGSLCPRPSRPEFLEVEPSSVCFTVPPGDCSVLLCSSHAVCLFFFFFFQIKGQVQIFISFYKNQVLFLQPHLPANLEILRLFKKLYRYL